LQTYKIYCFDVINFAHVQARHTEPTVGIFNMSQKGTIPL